LRIWVAAGAFFSLEILPEGGATYFLNLDQLEPANPDVVIWRFMYMDKLRDLIATNELYLCHTR
jgi:hypothetical protein